jgi:hypothetical protein
MAVGRITRIPGGFLVVLPGRPGILQEYVGECKELKYTEDNLGVRMMIRVFWQYMVYMTQWYPQLFSMLEVSTTSVAKQLGHMSEVN